METPMTQLGSLFSPINIGKLELSNRLVMAPMTLDLANQDETPSQRQIDYYVERARGGIGLIGLEVVTVDPDHRYQQRSLGLYSDDMIAGHKKLVDAIHAAGGVVQPQLVHPGPESLAQFYKGIAAIGPSVLRTPTTTLVCEEAKIEQLEWAVECFGDAACRAQEAGYDGIELHAAHSYLLLGSFLSPIRNLRQDEYGGKLEGRMKLLLQALANIRKKVGEDFPITMRLAGYERDPGGRGIDETQRMIPMLEQAGVDCFHISGGVTDASISKIIAGSSYRNGFNVAAARAVKLVANVPVMVVGRNWDPVAAAEIIANEEADMIVMGRPMFADPNLPNKLRSNQLDDVRMCNSCEVCVDGMMADASGVTCALNARCCREGEYPLEKATVSKRVLVIGGGPAGMEAARVACARGHRVTLIERHEQLGGAFKFASIVHPDNQVFLQYLVHQMTSLPIELVLGKTVSEKEIAEFKPDAIIVATGAAMTVPAITGADLPHVIKGPAVRQLITDIGADGAKSADAFDGTVAVVGCGLMGVELAICLARLGSKVHIVDSNTRIAEELGRGKKRRTEHSSELDSLGVPVNTGVAIDEIGEKELQISTADGQRHYLKADTVILIDSPQPDTRLFDRAQSLADEVYGIGDCTGFGLSKKAVEEATRFAYKL
jgi:2,4-dienoyl-CoA reductase (NADPH2)